MGFFTKLFKAEHQDEARGTSKPRVTATTDDDLYLRAAPLEPMRRRLLWMDPATLGLLVNSHTMIQEGNQLIEVQFSQGHIDWAKQINQYAIKAEQAGRANQHLKAIELYKEALKLAPGCDLYLMSIGCCYANAGDPRRGLKYLERANEISPGQERIRRNLLGIRQAAAMARR